MKSRQLEDVLSETSEVQGDCIIWTGASTGNENLYGAIKYNGKKYRVHRLVWQEAHGPVPSSVDIDHTCHNKKCFRLEHLRATTHKQNMENRKGAQAGSKAGIRGVSWNGKQQKYRATVVHHGVYHHLGYFTDPNEAGEHARRKRIELYTHNETDKEQVK